MFKILLIISGVLTFLRGHEAKFLHGGFDVQVESIFNCSKYRNKINPWTISYQKRKFNRTTEVFRFNANMSTPFDDTQSVDVNVSKWGNGIWLYNFIRIRQKNGCTLAFKMFGNLAKTLAEAAGCEAKCPIPKNNYFTKDIVLSFKDVMLIVAPGVFNVTVSVFQDKKILGCTELIVKVIEKIH